MYGKLEYLKDRNDCAGNSCKFGDRKKNYDASFNQYSIYFFNKTSDLKA